MGTKQALYDNGRKSITIIINDVTSFSIGILIALFERSVGFYSSLIEINAYHQPGVEAGKKAAQIVVNRQQKIVNFLKANNGKGFTVSEIASQIEAEGENESVFNICKHLVANNRIHIIQTMPEPSFQTSFRVI
jgi:glucose-6-phosphate isomerase